MAEIMILRHSMTQGNLEGRYIGCRTDEPLCEEGIRLLESRFYPAAERIYASPMKRCVETARLIWGNGMGTGQRKCKIRTETTCMGNRLTDWTAAPESQAAHILPIIPVPELRECDFGDFENKNYQELNGDPGYQAWIDSGGTLPFPGGESMEAFKNRCQAGFTELVREIAELEKETVSGRERDRRIAGQTTGEKEPAKTGRPLRVALVVHGGTIMAILERFGVPKRDYFDYQVKNGCGYLLTPVEGTDLWNYQCLP